jgi:hypothetical protein
MKGFVLKILDGIHVAFVMAQHSTWPSVFERKPFACNKALLLFSLCLATNLQVHSQSTFNLRDRYDFLACVLSNVYPTDSCYYVTGIIADTLEPYNTGALFMKLDLQGNPLSVKTIKSTIKTFETWYKGLIPTSDSCFVTVGHSFDTTTTTFFVKYKNNGDTVFTKSYFNPLYPTEIFIKPWAGVAEMPDNGYIIGCNISKPAGNTDIYLIRTDALGNKLWAKELGSSKRERSESIYTDAIGNIILGGIIENTNTNTQDYTYQCEIRQMDSLGNTIWTYLSPTSIGLRDAANDLVVLDDGSVVVASGVGHEIDLPSVNDVFFDRHIFKLSPQHQFLEWDLTYLDTELTWAGRTTNLVQLKNGSGFVMAGISYNPPSSPPYDEPIYGVIAKVSASGDSVWTRKYAYQPELGHVHEIFDMKETPDGGLIICGQSNDWDDNAIYPQQGWLLKLDKLGCLVPGCHLSDDTEESILQAASISIYPNPTSDYLNFYIHAPDRVNAAIIRIIDSNGRLIKAFKANDLSSTFILPIWEWANGAYWVQVVVDGELVSTEKFLKI